MHTFILKNPIILLFTFAFLIFFSSVPATAQDKMEVAGKISATVTEGHNFDVGDIEGHIFHISKSEGINTSTGKNSMMDGALVVNNNFSDLVKGTGHHQGFILMNKDGNSTVAKWEGNVTTTLSGNVPLIKFEGTFTYVSGTGKYANIQGGGKYKGMYISANTYVVDWDGEYSIKK
jgi:hypothetical protein